FGGKVGSTKNLAAPPAAAAAKDIAEDVAEDIPESLRSESAGASPAQPFMPELVIGCAFFGAVQNIVGFPYFLELGGGGLVVLAAVGMVLHGQAPIRLFYLLGGRGPGDPQYFVILTFGHEVSQYRTGRRRRRPVRWCCLYLPVPRSQPDFDFRSSSTSSNSASTTSSEPLSPSPAAPVVPAPSCSPCCA